MRDLIRFFVRFQNFFLFLLFEVIAIGMVVYHNPFQRSAFLNLGIDISGKIYTRTRVVDEYFNLQKINRQLVIENTALHNVLFGTKNDSVISKPYVDSLFQRGFYIIPARVIHNSIANRMNFIAIDRGRADGIKEGMGVISPTGVVGTVRSVSQHFAVVVPLLNTELSLSSKIGKDGSFGSVVWDGRNYRTARLDDIEKHARAAIGDTVSTSGYGAIFPADIPVGYIESVKTPLNGDFYEIHIRLATNFKQLFYVKVIGNSYTNEYKTISKPFDE